LNHERGIIDESPLDYTVSFKVDADGFVTMTAHLASDVWTCYATPRKPWDEHKAVLLATPDLHEISQSLSWAKASGQGEVWLLHKSGLCSAPIGV
jgi:hypothetical protein